MSTDNDIFIDSLVDFSIDQQSKSADRYQRKGTTKTWTRMVHCYAICRYDKQPVTFEEKPEEVIVFNPTMMSLMFRALGRSVNFVLTLGDLSTHYYFKSWKHFLDACKKIKELDWMRTYTNISEDAFKMAKINMYTRMSIGLNWEKITEDYGGKIGINEADVTKRAKIIDCILRCDRGKE